METLRSRMPRNGYYCTSSVPQTHVSAHSNFLSARSVFKHWFHFIRCVFWLTSSSFSHLGARGDHTWNYFSGLCGLVPMVWWRGVKTVERAAFGNLAARLRLGETHPPRLRNHLWRVGAHAAASRRRARSRLGHGSVPERPRDTVAARGGRRRPYSAAGAARFAAAAPVGSRGHAICWRACGHRAPSLARRRS